MKNKKIDEDYDPEDREVSTINNTINLFAPLLAIGAINKLLD